MRYQTFSQICKDTLHFLASESQPKEEVGVDRKGEEEMEMEIEIEVEGERKGKN